jgi:hypothetical protein
MAPVLTDGKGAAGRPDYTGMVLHQRYRLDSRLGAGGHATVWAARDLKLDRAVAIKIPHLHFESARLLAEARRVAMLKHPQIVPIYDFGSGEGFDFIVSELVEGPSLDQVLCRGPMSLAKTLQLIGDVAEGLDCAHREGLIHLDVKPSNILLDRAGRGKLCDFGIAVSSDAGLREVTGTLQYMAPEQVRGEKVSPQTDIYSLGVLLHKLCTGELPYRASNPAELRTEISGSEPVLSASLTPRLRAICQKAMRRDPTERYKHATDLAAEARRAARTNRGLLAPLMLLHLLVGPFVLSNWFLLAGAGVEYRHPAMGENWLARVAALPAEEQVKEVEAELGKRNPGLKHAGTAVIENGVVRRYLLITDMVTDISPLRGFPLLEYLFLDGTRTGQPNGILADLSPLIGMRIKSLGVAWNPRLRNLGPLRDLPLESLNCVGCGVEDLSPLAHASLRELICAGNPIRDLSPLRGLKLDLFHCNKTLVRDLSPLGGMRLRAVRCQETPVESLEPLRGQPLHLLECHNTNISDLAPISGSKFLWSLSIGGSRVTDLTPLKTLPQLTNLELSVLPGQEQSLLATLPKLVELNKRPVQEYLNPDPLR